MHDGPHTIQLQILESSPCCAVQSGGGDTLPGTCQHLVEQIGCDESSMLQVLVVCFSSGFVVLAKCARHGSQKTCDMYVVLELFSELNSLLVLAQGEGWEVLCQSFVCVRGARGEREGFGMELCVQFND